MQLHIMRLCTAAVAVLFLIAGDLFAQEKSVNIQWDGVAGAKEYQVEVVDPLLQPVFRKTTAETRISFPLPPGDYHYRLSSVDKLGRSSEWSDWKRLRVVSDTPPELTDESGQVFDLEGRETSILLRGKNFQEESVIALRDRAGSSIPIQSREMLTSGGVRLFFDPSQIKPGTYDLVLRNPPGRERLVPNYLRVPVPPEKVYNYWQPLVPGISQMRRGETLRGGLFLGAFIGLAGGAGYNYYQGSTLIARKKSDILLRFYTDPVLYYFAQDTLKANVSDHTRLAEYYYYQGNLYSKEIAFYTSNYNAMRAALGVLYVFHLTDLLRIGKTESISYTPGELSRPIVTGIVAGDENDSFAALGVYFQF